MVSGTQCLRPIKQESQNEQYQLVEAFLDSGLRDLSVTLCNDKKGGHAAVIDPVLDYDPKSGRTRTHGAQRLVDFVRASKFDGRLGFGNPCPR